MHDRHVPGQRPFARPSPQARRTNGTTLIIAGTVLLLLCVPFAAVTALHVLDRLSEGGQSVISTIWVALSRMLAWALLAAAVAIYGFVCLVRGLRLRRAQDRRAQERRAQDN